MAEAVKSIAANDRAKAKKENNTQSHQARVSFVLKVVAEFAVIEQANQANAEIRGYSREVGGTNDGLGNGGDGSVLNSANKTEEKKQSVVFGGLQRLAKGSQTSEHSSDGHKKSQKKDKAKGNIVFWFLMHLEAEVDQEAADHRAKKKKERDHQHSQSMFVGASAKVVTENSGKARDVRDKTLASQEASDVEKAGLKGHEHPDGNITFGVVGYGFITVEHKFSLT